MAQNMSHTLNNSTGSVGLLHIPYHTENADDNESMALALSTMEGTPPHNYTVKYYYFGSEHLIYFGN